MMYKIQEKLLQPINTSLASLLGLYKVLLGIWLLLPFNTFQDAHLNLNSTDEILIGIVTIIIGGFMLTSTFLGKYKLLVYSAAAGFYYWVISMSWMLYTDIIGFSWITAMIVAIYCGFIFINLKANRMYYDQ